VQGANLAKDAGVKHLILFHHDPLHNDEFVHRMEEAARSHFEHTDAAREGWEITL
jgi:ribonuclease BN (tRNA processing enzyme)